MDLTLGGTSFDILNLNVKESLVEPMEWFVLDSKFNNTSAALFKANGAAAGELFRLEDPDNPYARVFFRDSEFNVPSGSYFLWYETFLTFSYHDNSVDRLTGKTSESAGTVSMTAAGGETFIDVDPDLWWVPMQAEYVTYSGTDAGLVASVAPVCSGTIKAFGLPTSNSDDKRDCNLRFTLAGALTPGEQVTFDWAAAVQPWPDGVVVPDTSGW